MMGKYIRLVDGTKSNAADFEFKINEVNTSKIWNPNTYDPKEMGGFNFSTEEKILRWIHRGDTVYDVEIPPSAEVIDCPSINCPHGIFRTNKIIITNPKKLTEEMAMDYYKKSELPENTYFQCIVVMLYKNYINVAKKIIEDKVNKENIENCIKEFERMISDKHDGKEPIFNYDTLWPEAKEIYNILIEKRNNKKYHNIYTGEEVNNFFESLGYISKINNKNLKVIYNEKEYEYKNNEEYVFDELKFIICTKDNKVFDILFDKEINDTNSSKLRESFAEGWNYFKSAYRIELNKKYNFKYLENEFNIEIINN